MSVIRKIFRFIGEYFVFVGGFLFVFVIGALYAFIRPEGLVFNLVFLLIAVGWVVFLIRYFWELLDKNNENDTET